MRTVEQIDMAKKWIAALRSGKYKQGQFNLRTKVRGVYEYCCLGVCLDVNWPNQKWKIISVQDTRPKRAIYGKFLTSECLRAEQLAELGLPYLRQKELMWMNDEEGRSFAEIADILEQEVLSEMESEYAKSQVD